MNTHPCGGTPGSPGDRRPSALYGRRQGRALRPGRRDLVASLLPRLAVTLPAAGGRVDPFELFDARPTAVWLEVGFGFGEHLAEQAARRPDIGFIGCEVFINGIAGLLAEVVARGLRNVRLYPGDARDVLAVLPDGCLERLFVLFPDPWPKTRHRQRRFVSAETREEFARVLRPGGDLRLASDHADYVRWIEAHFASDGTGVWQPLHGEVWGTTPEDWVTTRYETKALRQGASCAYFQFRRATGS